MNRPLPSEDDRDALRVASAIINPRNYEVPARQVGGLEPLPVAVRAAALAKLLGFDEVQQPGWAVMWLTFRNAIAAVDPALLVEPRSKYGWPRPAVRTAEGVRVSDPRVEAAIDEVSAITSVTCGVCEVVLQ